MPGGTQIDKIRYASEGPRRESGRKEEENKKRKVRCVESLSSRSR